MQAGLQIWNQDGALMLDGTHRLGRLKGTLYLDGTVKNGTQNADLSDGTPFCRSRLIFSSRISTEIRPCR